MTERLATLLHAEAEALEVPAPPAAAILTSGRGLRRRRRTSTGLVVAVSMAAVGTVAVLSQGDGRLHGPTRTDSVGFSSMRYADEGALAVDRELYVAGVQVPFEEAVKSFYYTADGVVVRSGTSPWTDDGDVDHFTLVLPDGTKTQLDLRTHDRVVSTEPDSNRLAYAARNGGRWDIVIVDLDSGSELSRTTVEGSFTWGGWEAPPVALDGALVWTHFDNGWTEVDWTTGEVRQVPGTEAVHEIQNGRYLVEADDAWEVRQMHDGSLLRTVPRHDELVAWLSPDGRYLKVMGYLNYPELVSDPAPYILDLDTGARGDARGLTHSFGWTPDGRVLNLDKQSGSVQSCDPIAAACRDTGLVVDLDEDSTIRLGGNSYES